MGRRPSRPLRALAWGRYRPRVDDPEDLTPTQRALERAALRYADDFARGEGDFDLLRREIRAILEGKFDP